MLYRLRPRIIILIMALASPCLSISALNSGNTPQSIAQKSYYFWGMTLIGLIALTIIIAIIWHIYQQREKAIIWLKIEHKVRLRIARELHNIIGGMLTATRLAIENEKKDDALQLLNETGNELRKLSHHLMPESLDRKGLHVAIEDFCNMLPNVNFTYYGQPHRLPKEIELLCYSSIHELINNALAHGKAESVVVQMMFDSNSISVIVADDGKGFDPKGHFEGMGLRNIQEGLHIFKGNLSIVSDSHNGTEVHFQIPIPKKYKNDNDSNR